MHLLVALTVILFACAACVQQSSVSCDDDRTCPAGTVCDDSHALCVLRAQTTACAGMPDGQVCTADEFVGICDRGVCVEGCANGNIDYDWPRARDEECDDGNLKSRDGCSSTCRIEKASWVEWQSPWQGRLNAATVYDSTRQTIVMVGGRVQGGLDDAHWERDRNGRWQRLELSPRPPALEEASLVYDSVRGVVVLFGGRRADSNFSNETWEYNGTGWTQVSTPSSPPVRSGAVMFYDSIRSRVVLFGGLTTAFALLGDTWEYNGTTWTQLTTTGPGGRASAAFAWDSTRQRALLFGGIPQNNETWEWNGTSATWAQRTTNGTPDIRFAAAMTYVPGATQRMFMFGGSKDSFLTFGDFWQYNPATLTWSQIAGPTSPPGRLNARLVFDAANSALVMVGGNPLGGAGRADVWEYSLTTGIWLERTPNFPALQEARLVEDEAHGELVALGLDGHTWVFDRNQMWRDVGALPADAALARRFHGVAYDRARDRVVAFGGDRTCAAFGDTLEWDATQRQWSTVTTVGPPARTVPALSYDPERDVIVLAGGATSVCAGAALFSDTWELSGSTWTRTVESGPTIRLTEYDPSHARLLGIDAAGATWTYAAGAWTPLVPARDAFATYGAVAFNPERNKLTWFGGNGNETASNLWELDADDWREVDVIGQLPPPRIFPALAAHRPSRSLVLVGGGAFGTVLGDTWQFSYRSDDPDELCSDGFDNDTDTLIDRADPDCP